MSTKLKTMKLQGKDYVQVKDRLIYFNETYANGSIQTQMENLSDGVFLKAIIWPDVENEKRFFTGRSYGKLGKEKAIEKLETVAVGRALAFMGIGVDESVASYDEINEFQGANRGE